MADTTVEAAHELLRSMGATDADIAAVHDSDQLQSLVVNLVLWGTVPNRSLADIAAALGVDADRIRPAARNAGFLIDDDTPAFVDEDHDLFAAFAFAAEMFDDAMLQRYTRAIAQATARIAEASVSLFVRREEGPTLGDGSLLERTEIAIANIRAFTPAVPNVVHSLLLHAFVAAGDRFRATALDDTATVQLAVAFVDLTDSTGLVAVHGARAIEPALTDFEAAAANAAARRGGWLVKLIGDAAMLAIPDPVAAVEAAAEVVERVGADSRLAGARAGVSFGSMLHGEGDYYGETVTRAARLVGLAATGSVVVDDSVAERLGPARCESMGSQLLRGYEAPIEVFAFTQ